MTSAISAGSVSANCADKMTSRKNYIYAIITVLIWATNAPLAKALLSDLPSLQTLSVSSFLAFGFLLVLNLKKGGPAVFKRYRPRDYAIMAGLGFIGLFVYTALYYLGLTQLTSQEACIVNYLWPIMLVIFSCLLLREKLTVMKLIAMISSFVGIIILSLGGSETTSGNRPLGILCCLAAAACYGLFSVLNKKAAYDQNIAMMVIWLTTALCSLVLGLATETWVPIRSDAWLGMLWLGIVISAVAYLLWAMALSDAASTASIANLAYLTPFLSILVSHVFLGEPLRFQAVIALIFIVGGIILQNIFEKKNI